MKLLAAAALIGLAPLAVHADCLPVSGTVKLTVDGSCQVKNSYSSSNVAFTDECYAVTLSILGIPTGYGYAGVTKTTVLGEGGVTETPAVLADDASPAVVETARSAIGVGWGLFRTVLYSSDVVVARPTLGPGGELVNGVVTEQIVITGTNGRGLFANTTGHLVVLGNSIGRNAQVVGELCSN